MKPLFVVTTLDLKRGVKSLIAAYPSFEQARIRQKAWNEVFIKDRIEKIATIETIPLVERED